MWFRWDFHTSSSRVSLLPLNSATAPTPPPAPTHNKWFRDRHLTQIKLLRYKMFVEASSETADEDTLEVVWCEDSPSELAAAHFSNIKEPAWGQYQENERESNLEPWCNLEPLDQIGPEVRLLLDFSLMWANKFLFGLSHFELHFLFSYNPYMCCVSVMCSDL